jgi:hypothetical protein
MDDVMEIPATPPVPLTEAEQASLADEVLYELACVPIPPDAPCTRAAWVIMISSRGAMTRAILPVDNRLDRPEPAVITELRPYRPAHQTSLPHQRR